MARIRTIKPEFFTSESVCNCSPLARLMFIGLWCEADREGLLPWKPKTIKIRYLPTDNCDIDELSQELIDEGMITIHSDEKGEICQIPAFGYHQVINNRERESDLSSRVVHASPRVKAEGREGRKEGKGREGKGREQEELKTPCCPHKEIIGIYHELLPTLPRVVETRWKGSERERNLKSRWTEDTRHQDLEFWKWFFGSVNNFPHQLGENERGWKADIGWLLKRTNFDKMIERMINA